MIKKLFDQAKKIPQEVSFLKPSAGFVIQAFQI